MSKKIEEMSKKIEEMVSRITKEVKKELAGILSGEIDKRAWVIREVFARSLIEIEFKVAFEKVYGMNYRKKKGGE